MAQQPYNTKVSNWLSDLMLKAKRQLRETIPTQEQSDLEIQSIISPQKEVMRPTYTRGQTYKDPLTGKIRVKSSSVTDVIGDLMNVADVGPAIGMAGSIIGGAGRFGEEAKKAKALLKEWKELGLDDLNLDDAIKYIKASLKDIMPGGDVASTASKITEAGGNPIGHLDDSQIAKELYSAGTYPNLLDQVKGKRSIGYPAGEEGLQKFLGDNPVGNWPRGVTPENPTGVTQGEFGPELEGVPYNQAPRTPEEFDAFANSIPSAAPSAEDIARIKQNTAVPGQEFNPATMVDRRQYEAPRRFGRTGTGRRQEDQAYAQAKQMIDEAIISGVPPDEIVKELEKVGLKPEDYADIFGQSSLEAATPVGGLGPGRETPPGVASPMAAVTPGNVTGTMRQQPVPGDDFEGAVNKLLQATNSWDETVKGVIKASREQKLSKEEVTGKLMDSFGHENAQLSTLVNKYWE